MGGGHLPWVAPMTPKAFHGVMAWPRGWEMERGMGGLWEQGASMAMNPLWLQAAMGSFSLNAPDPQAGTLGSSPVLQPPCPGVPIPYPLPTSPGGPAYGCPCCWVPVAVAAVAAGPLTGAVAQNLVIKGRGQVIGFCKCARVH